MVAAGVLFLFEVGRKVKCFSQNIKGIPQDGQSQFDNSRKRNGILRKNIIGILVLFGIKGRYCPVA